VAYKRAINSGLSISEYSDEKAKNEFECFYKEFEKSIKFNIKKLVKKGYVWALKMRMNF